jgi:hypothetical protein
MTEFRHRHAEREAKDSSDAGSHVLVDMADPINTKSLQQSKLRDTIGKQHGSVILFCSDADLSKCTDVVPKGKDDYSPKNLNKLPADWLRS